MKTLSQGLTKGYIAFLEHFNLNISGKMSIAAMTGQRKSGAKGTSIEYSDFRQYVPGDDIRRMDWNSYARSGKLITKVSMEEKQAEINIFLDLSRSMGFYEDKAFYAKIIAASLSYIALKNGDKVNIYGWSGGIKEWRLNNSSKNSFPKVISFLEGLEFDGVTSLKETVSSGLIKGMRGISFIISDLFIDGGFEGVIDTLRYKKQEVNVVQVLSKDEVNPPLGGNLCLTDCETGEHKDITVSLAVIESYKKALLSMQNGIGEYCRKSGARFSAVNTDMLLQETLKIIL